MRMTDAAVTTGVAPTGRAWIARPWVDLVIGCGGWSLPLLLVAYATPVATSAGWSSAFSSLALVANYPHYMATIYRAYGRADFGPIASGRCTAPPYSWRWPPRHTSGWRYCRGSSPPT